MSQLRIKTLVSSNAMSCGSLLRIILVLFWFAQYKFTKIHHALMFFYLPALTAGGPSRQASAGENFLWNKVTFLSISFYMYLLLFETDCCGAFSSWHVFVWSLIISCLVLLLPLDWQLLLLICVSPICVSILYMAVIINKGWRETKKWVVNWTQPVG